MTKAERRQRARQRRRLAAAAGRQPVATAPEANSPSVSPSQPEPTSSASPELRGAEPLATASAPAPNVESPKPRAASTASPEESPFITGPIVPRPSPLLAGSTAGLPFEKHRPQDEPRPVREHEPLGGAAEEQEDEDLEDEDDLEDDEDDESEGDESDESDEDEDEDEDDIEATEDEGLFEAACVSIDLGHRLTWSELVRFLCSTEVRDPRLGLLATLLSETDAAGQPVPITGARVLRVLEEIGFEDLVKEARETVTLAASPEVTQLVEEDSPDGDEKGANAPSAEPPKPSVKPGKKQRPLRASQVRALQSAAAAPSPTSVAARRTTP